MRRWITGLVPATFLGVALLSMLGNPHPAGAQEPTTQESERLAVVTGLFDAWSRGDVDAALSAFADNAVFIGARETGTCSAQTPCTSLAPIRQTLEANAAIHLCQTIRTVEVSGTTVLGQFETRSDNDRANGVERLKRSFIAQVPHDQIIFFAVVNDLADPETAFTAAVAAGTQAPGAPLPNPETLAERCGR
jgi:ketosteroid isomerase-like protein